MNCKVDARGLSCPKPVIETKKVLDKMDEGSMVTIVDNEVAMNNVSKLAQSFSCQVEVKKEKDDFYIYITKGEKTEDTECIIEDRDLVILFGRDILGSGSEELGKILMKGYIYALTEYSSYPKTLLFLNSGVKLTTEGSEVLDYLKLLEKEGVDILSCGTCLDYFHLKDKLKVGSITNMYNILDTLHSAKNRITL